jgi:hypothetical protein
LKLKVKGEWRMKKFYGIKNVMVDRDDVQKWQRSRSEVRQHEIISILRGGRSEFERIARCSVNGSSLSKVHSIYVVEQIDDKILAIYPGLREIDMRAHECIQFRSLLSVQSDWIEYAAQRFTGTLSLQSPSGCSRLTASSQYMIGPDVFPHKKSSSASAQLGFLWVNS